MNRSQLVNDSIQKLSLEFTQLDLSFHEMKGGRPGDLTSYWPGSSEEDIMICVFKGSEMNEPFHRQDFFFINYAYTNSFLALSSKYDNHITIHEDECYIGQPYSGYALRGKYEKDTIIIGVLIQRDSFFHEFLPTIYTDSALFRFFTTPHTNRYSDEYIHLSFTKRYAVRTILEMMVVEYANKTGDTQRILKPMLQILFLEILRRHHELENKTAAKNISEQILDYIGDHSDIVKLKDIADTFGYNPNYISALLHRTTGRTFSDILLEKRMERAVLLMKNTTLSLEEIAALLGYGNHSNFYKAFKGYFGTTPRNYLSTRIR